MNLLQYFAFLDKSVLASYVLTKPITVFMFHVSCYCNVLRLLTLVGVLKISEQRLSIVGYIAWLMINAFNNRNKTFVF